MYVLIFITLHEKFSVNDTGKRLGDTLNVTSNVRHKNSLMLFLLGRIFFLVLGIKPRSLHMLDKGSALDFYSNPVFTFLHFFFFIRVLLSCHQTCSVAQEGFEFTPFYSGF